MKPVHNQLSTPIKSESTINRSRYGFSLIELMVVITLFTITTIAVTTSYISFQGREILKNAALQLKSDLRLAQNSAQTGDKVTNDGSSAGCQSTSGTSLSSTTLGGWYLSISHGGSSYTIKGVCLAPSPVPPASPTNYTETAFGSKTASFPAGVTVSSITCTGCSTTFVAGNSLSVFFVPLTNSVSFFQNIDIPDFFNTSGVLNASYITGNGETVITLYSSDGDYEIHITQSGGINETRI